MTKPRKCLQIRFELGDLRLRQIALAIDYLVWMPVATAVSFFATVFGYGLALTAIEPFPRDAAIMLTIVLLLGWPAWICLLAWNTGNEASATLRRIAGLAFAVPTTVLLVLVLDVINACNAGGGFPLSGGDACPFS